MEEALIKLLDDLLLSRGGVHFRGSNTDGLVKLLEGVGFGIKIGFGEGPDHLLHNLSHGVMGDEVVVLEKRVENRSCNEVLREH